MHKQFNLILILHKHFKNFITKNLVIFLISGFLVFIVVMISLGNLMANQDIENQLKGLFNQTATSHYNMNTDRTEDLGNNPYGNSPLQVSPTYTAKDYKPTTLDSLFPALKTMGYNPQDPNSQINFTVPIINNAPYFKIVPVGKNVINDYNKMHPDQPIKVNPNSKATQYLYAIEFMNSSDPNWNVFRNSTVADKLNLLNLPDQGGTNKSLLFYDLNHLFANNTTVTPKNLNNVLLNKKLYLAPYSLNKFTKPDGSVNPHSVAGTSYLNFLYDYLRQNSPEYVDINNATIQEQFTIVNNYLNVLCNMLDESIYSSLVSNLTYQESFSQVNPVQGSIGYFIPQYNKKNRQI